MNTAYIWIILCVNGATCDHHPKPFYSDKIYYSKQSCQEEAHGVAINMHLMNGNDYGYKCEVNKYEPKKLK